MKEKASAPEGGGGGWRTADTSWYKMEPGDKGKVVDVQRSGQDINKQQLPAILPILPIYR